MRAYTVAAAAVTLKVPRKWVDNTLSHYVVPGVLQRKQGVTRKITPQAVLILEICLELMRTLGVPLHLALEAAKAVAAPDESTTEPTTQLPLGPHTTLTVDVAAIMRDMNARLANAVEVAPSPKRGRPPRPTLIVVKKVGR